MKNIEFTNEEIAKLDTCMNCAIESVLKKRTDEEYVRVFFDGNLKDACKELEEEARKMKELQNKITGRNEQFHCVKLV